MMSFHVRAIGTQLALGFVLALIVARAGYADPLPGTELLTWEGDIAARLVDHVDRFLLRQLDQSIAARGQAYRRDFSSPAAYRSSMQPARDELARLLGVRDARVPAPTPQVISVDGPPQTTLHGTTSIHYGHGNHFKIYAIRWPVLEDVEGYGLLLIPDQGEPIADVIALPDCEVTPEQLVGLQPAVDPVQQYARRLAESGCRVVVPLLVNRQRGGWDWGPRPAPSITNREMVYRSAFELGRGLIGYEVQTVQSLVDWMQRTAPARRVGVVGWGEGGLIALYASALDPRIEGTLVSGYFEPRESMWQEPLDRNVFALLDHFGDAELAMLIAPRALIIEAARGPEVQLEGHGGAPARLRTPPLAAVEAEVQRAAHGVADLKLPVFPQLTISGQGNGPAGSDAALQGLLTSLAPASRLTAVIGSLPQYDQTPLDFTQLHHRHLRELDRHTQVVLRESPKVRDAFFQKLDTSSPAAYEATSRAYRDYFANEVIGRWPIPLTAPHPRTRQVYDTERWVGYEVVLDVFEDVFAYGLLLVPKDLQPNERRPVVVCQHGLEGRPQDTVGLQGSGYYAGFAGALANRGFITFAPQNLYIGEDRFRTLQRKSNPLRKTLFSTIVPQHQQIVDWLQSLPFVDPERVAFYGLSYGGKSAMRIPPLVTDYCLSICSADFNEWVDKNASTSNPRSYVWSGEYEIFEFDLGSTFNYSEMSALIAPRPFMVERGHFDGVADDWTVGWEFAKVQYRYAAQLGLGDRCQIEWFVGPHSIHAVGTYEFLHRHLRWPAPQR